MVVVSLIFGALIVGVLWLHWYQTRSYTAKLINAFPGPTTPFLIGYAFHWSRKLDISFKQLQVIAKGYHQTFKLWYAHQAIIYIITPEDAEIVLSSRKLIDKGIVYNSFKPWLGTGLLTSTGSKWQHRRKILSQSFHFNILRIFVAIFGYHCEDLVLELKEECKKPKTNILPIMTKFTLSAICDTIMGTKLDERDETHNKYMKSVHEICQLISKRYLSPWLYPNIVFNLSRTGWKQRNCIKMLHNFTENVIKEREKNFKCEDVEDLESSSEDAIIRKKRFTMLDLLISAKHRNEIDDEGIKEEVDTFMFAGHDTTAGAISSILLTLANHKDVQEKIFMELDDIFGTSKRPASYDDLQKMKYTELCIKECLRLYPVVPFLLRTLNEDTFLTHHTAPAGIQAVIFIYHIHRDPNIFKDPERFDPERFLPENCKGRHPFAYIPFSAGLRNCIGQKFAMLELKSIISCVFRHFKIIPIDSPADLTWMVDILLRTTGDINIKFETRDF